MVLELVDYSRTANANWDQLAAEIKAAGKVGVGRYCVNDKAPNGRGIGAAEYAAMEAAGIDVFLYWESSEGWMKGGYMAGVNASYNAQQNIDDAGMPHDTPVYFACDYDAPPEDQNELDDCLRGCASVLGFERVGFYAGYWPLLRSKNNGTARWFCQTLAWSGGNLMPGVHLFQYGFNEFIYGTNVDLVMAYYANFGQALPIAAPPPAPVYAKPAPITWKQGDVGPHDLNGAKALAFLLEVTCVRPAEPKQSSTAKSPATGPVIKQGERKVAIGSYRAGAASNAFVVLEDGSRVRRSSFRPLAPLV